MATKVALDLRWVRSAQIDGIGRYSLSLAKELAKGDLDLTFLYHQESLRPTLQQQLGPQAQLSRVPFDILSLADWLKLPGFLGNLGTQVLISPHYITAPRHPHYRLISIVPDLIPFFYGSQLTHPSWQLQLFYRTAVLPRLMLRSADRLVAISKSTKDDLVRYLKLDARKIEVIYPVAKPLPKVSGGRPSYLLYLGRMEPYKNLGRLLGAYAGLPLKLRQSYPLLIGGKTYEPYYSALLRRAAALGAADQVKFLGYVTEAELPSLYAGAAVFVYPSLYEGFGLPVVEARLMDVPVITSKVSSLPEAAGAGAVLVDPTDTTALTEAMEKVLTDDRLRQKLIQADRNIADEFGWNMTTVKFKEIIDDL